MLAKCNRGSIGLTDPHRLASQIVLGEARKVHRLKAIGGGDGAEFRNISCGRVQFAKNEFLRRERGLRRARENIRLREKRLFCIIRRHSQLGDIGVCGDHLIDREMETILERVVARARSLGLYRKIGALR